MRGLSAKMEFVESRYFVRPQIYAVIVLRVFACICGLSATNGLAYGDIEDGGAIVSQGVASHGSSSRWWRRPRTCVQRNLMRGMPSHGGRWRAGPEWHRECPQSGCNQAGDRSEVSGTTPPRPVSSESVVLHRFGVDPHIEHGGSICWEPGI